MSNRGGKPEHGRLLTAALMLPKLDGKQLLSQPRDPSSDKLSYLDLLTDLALVPLLFLDLIGESLSQ